MNIVFYIPILSWVVFIIYWIISARHVKPSQEIVFNYRKFSTRLVILIVAIEAINIFLYHPSVKHTVCLLGFFGCQNKHMSFQLLPLPLVILGNLLTVIGVSVAVSARHTLGENWSANIEFKKHHQLITTGIYAHIRHPIYSGMLAMLLGMILVFFEPVMFIIFGIVIVFTLFKITGEEKLMTKHFPKDYPIYKKKVRMLIPNIL